MTAPSAETLWELVTSHHEGILATIGPGGFPQLSNIWYVPDPDRRLIRISTTATRAKGRNLLRDSRAALHVPGPNFFTFAVAEGDVTINAALAPGDGGTDELHEVHTVFDGEAERPAFDHQMIQDQRVVIRLEVEKLYGLVVPGR